MNNRSRSLLVLVCCALSFGGWKCKGYDAGMESSNLDSTAVARVAVDGIGAISGAALSLNPAAHTAEATTSTCATAVNQGCDNNFFKSVTYSGCQIAGTSYTATGNIQLQYNISGCRYLNLDDNVRRTMSPNLTVTGTNGYTLETTTDAHRTYVPNLDIGGGTVIYRANGYTTINIDGISKTHYDSQHNVIEDTSIRTSAPFHSTDVTGSTITISSGTLNVYQNISHFTTVITVKDLVLTPAACCHPVSGSATLKTVLENGAIASTGTLKFSSTCGQATYTQDNQALPILLESCQ